MNWHRSIVIIVACLAGCGFAAPHSQGPSQSEQDAARDPQQKIALLVKEIEMERVTDVEILNLPSDIDTNAAVTPERLKNIYHCRLTISRWGLPRESPSLIAALQHTRVTRVKETGEVRWGLLFTLSGTNVEEVYLDGFGQRGQIGGVPVRFEGQLHQWLLGLSRSMK
jgi:hypothetical protein